MTEKERIALEEYSRREAAKAHYHHVVPHHGHGVHHVTPPEVIAEQPYHAPNPFAIPPVRPNPYAPGMWLGGPGPHHKRDVPFEHWGHADSDRYGPHGGNAGTLSADSGNGNGSSRIIIFKQAVFDDVDAATFRRASVGLANLPQEVTYEVKSDSHDPYDKGILTRHALYWDGRLRRKLAALLNSENTLSDTDDYAPMEADMIDKTFVYDFNVSFNDNMYTSTTEQIHRFLVLGILFNWYREAGVECEITAQELEDMMDDIRGHFRTGYAVTPLTPFDPKF